MHRFGERTKKARESKRLTQSQLAARVGAHRVTIAKIEAGKRAPKLLLGCRIARALQVHIFWLCGFVDNPLPGIQYETEAEYRNALAYLALDKPERTQLVEMMTDYHRARRITTKG